MLCNILQLLSHIIQISHIIFIKFYPTVLACLLLSMPKKKKVFAAWRRFFPWIFCKKDEVFPLLRYTQTGPIKTTVSISSCVCIELLYLLILCCRVVWMIAVYRRSKVLELLKYYLGRFFFRDLANIFVMDWTVCIVIKSIQELGIWNHINFPLKYTWKIKVYSS